MAADRPLRSDVQLTIQRDHDALMSEAALQIATLCAERIRHHGRFSWALSGGSTPRALYRVLASPAFASRVEWSRVDFFWGDERCVPPDHPDSNFRMVRETLLDGIGAAPARVHRMRGEDEPASAARAYESTLQRFFGEAAGSAPPRFDLILLGMGADGHTASLFPGTPALLESQRWVVENRASPSDVPRLTLTLPVLNAAAQVSFLVTGASKAARVSEALAAESEADVLPARQIRPAHGRLVWWLDAAAASQLEVAR